MKKYTSLLSLLILSSLYISPVLADKNDADNDRTVLNKVKIINNTSKDSGYVIISASDNTDLIYGIKAKKSDTYHAKATGDVNATIKVAQCNKINKVTGVCNEYTANSMKNCVKESRYDFYKVKSVKINSLGSCSVTCNDGDTTSCLAS